MSRLVVFDCEWNAWNGFWFEVLRIDWKSFSGSLLALHIGHHKLTFDVFFVHFDVQSPL